MAAVHRDTDLRECGARTTVEGQSTVFVNGLLCAVENDPETHLEGRLVSQSAGTVTVENRKLIVITDTATGDLAGHPMPPTDPEQGSPNVNAY